MTTILNQESQYASIRNSYYVPQLSYWLWFIVVANNSGKLRNGSNDLYVYVCCLNNCEYC